MAIQSVELVGHKGAGVGKLALTKRRTRQLTQDRFPDKIRDNLLIVTGTDLSNNIQSLIIRFDGSLYRVLVLDARLVRTQTPPTQKLYVWAAAFQNVRSVSEDGLEEEAVERTFGVGAITITIETSDEEIVSGDGDFTEVNVSPP